MLKRLAILIICSLHSQAWGQWVHFQDRTPSRLAITSIPANDGEEKDLAVGDFDRDGWTDVVVVRKLPFSNPGGKADLLLMNEAGVLTDRTALYAPGFQTTLSDARDVFVTDIDGDDWPDLVLANTFGQQPLCYRNQGDDPGGTWLGFADESTTRLPVLTIPKLQFCALCAGDLNGDGFPDLYFSNYVKKPDIALDVLLINDGTGHFTDESQVRLGDRRNSAFGTSVDLRDMDYDGDLDIIKTSSLHSVPPWNDIGIFVIFNEGAGTFQNFQSVPSASPYMFAIDDLTGDGLLDLYVVNDTQDFVVTCVSADSALAEPLDFDKVVLDSPRTTFLGGNLQCVDFDGDGDPDVAVADSDIDLGVCENAPEDPRKFALFRNISAPDGMLVDPWGTESNVWNQNVFDFAVLDIDGDGKLDILAGLCEGYGVWMQENTLHLPEVEVDFGETPLGTAPTASVTLCNNGTDPLVITGITSSDPAFQIVGTGFTMQPFECIELEVAFSPALEGPYAGSLQINGDLPRTVNLQGTAVIPAIASMSENSLEVRTTLGSIEHRIISLSNIGGTILEVNVQVEVPGDSQVLLLAETSTQDLMEDALQEIGVVHAVADLNTVTALQAEPYDVLLVALISSPVTPEAMTFLTEAVNGGKTIIFIGSSTDPDFLTGLQGMLSHFNDPGWKQPAAPHFSIVDPDHPLSDGLPMQYEFVASTASWYRIQPTDPEAWVAAENGDGAPCLLSKRVGAGLLIYFTNWPLSLVWSDPGDLDLMKQVVRNAVAFNRTAWLSVTPRIASIGLGDAIDLDFVFHTIGRPPGISTANVIVSTNDPTNASIIIPISLEVLTPPLTLPDLRVRAASTTQVDLDLFGVPGQRYRIEKSEGLLVWSAVQEVTTSEELTEVQVPRSVEADGESYRAVEVPE